MHWLDPHETELAVSQEVYERCEIIVMEPSEFERHESLSTWFLFNPSMQANIVIFTTIFFNPHWESSKSY